MTSGFISFLFQNATQKLSKSHYRLQASWKLFHANRKVGSKFEVDKEESTELY